MTNANSILYSIAKASNDLLNKDFYHLSAAALEVKSNTPNNVAFKVTGKSTHEGATSGLVRSIEDEEVIHRLI